MPSLFPGIDPYLESPRYWQDFHDSFITYAREALQPQLPPRYRARISERLVLEATERVMIPDITVVRHPVPRPPIAEPGGVATAVEVEADEPTIFAALADDLREPYIEIIDRAGQRVITVIELLSPINKQVGEGRNRYLEKQQEVLRGSANLVEIDLLRAGDPMPMRVMGNGTLGDYRLVVSRSQRRPRADVYLFGVRHPIPDVPIPLRPGEAEPVLALNQIVHDLYDRAGYDLAVDYSRPPVPPLAGEDALWAAQRVQQHAPATEEQK